MAAQVAPPMMEREMITMIVDILPVFYYKKMVRYMPSSFVDLVFAGKRIKVGLRRGKFNYDASTSAGNRRTRTSGAKKKEGDARAVTTAHTSPSSQQTPHNPHVPISLAPIQLLGQYRISLLPDAHPTEHAKSTKRFNKTTIIIRKLLRAPFVLLVHHICDSYIALK